MKCQKAEKLLILQHSGELKTRLAGKVGAHLEECAACRDFHQILISSQNAFMPMAEPGLKVLQDIKRKTRLHAPVEPEKIPWFHRKAILAVAASLLVCLGLFSTFNSYRTGVEFTVSETQLLNMDDQMINIMYNGLSEDDLAFNFLMTYEGDTEG